MNRRKEVKTAINLSNRIIARLRRISVYKTWNKRDFVVCQSQHDKLPTPNKSDHVKSYEALRRFADRNDIPIPIIKKGVKRRRKPNLTYDGTHGFTAWRKVRYEALVRAGGHCECCGATVKSSGGPLHVDHIKPKSIYPELELKLSNLQVLCADCNVGKGNWDETNWREKNADRDAEELLDAEHLAKITRIY